MAEESVQRRLAAIVAVDVAGYSRLMEADETGTLAALKAHRNATDPLIYNHGGRIVGSAGDGLLLEFPSVVAAVECAVAAQRVMAERNETLPEDRRMLYRIGVNLGDVIVDGDDIHGDGVNIAARLEALAEPGGVCISGSVYENVRKKVAATFHDLGDRRVKNISTPVRVWRLDMSGAQAEAKAAAETKGEVESSAIAVLPFENMSGDAEQDYFSDGLTEDIITALSSDHRLKVLARHSTFAFKGRSVDVRQVARELDARYVLEGSVRKGTDRIRVSARLIDAETGHHMWADRYERDIGDIFEVQDEMVEAIVGQIAPELIKEMGARVRRAHPASLDAYDLTLRGWWHYYQRTKSGTEEAERNVRLALEKDPTSSMAHASLALFQMASWFSGWTRASREFWREVVELAEASVRLDHRSAMSRIALSQAYLGTRRYDEQLEQISRAVDLNPYLAHAHGFLGQALFMNGRHKESIAASLAALRLSPYEPDKYHWLANLVFAHYLLGEYDAALAWAKQGLLDAPRYFQISGGAAAALAQLDRITEAEAYLRDFLRQFPDMTAGTYRRILRMKQPADVECYLDGLKKAGLPE